MTTTCGPNTYQKSKILISTILVGIDTKKPIYFVNIDEPYISTHLNDTVSNPISLQIESFNDSISKSFTRV